MTPLRRKMREDMQIRNYAKACTGPANFVLPAWPVICLNTNSLCSP